MEKSRVGVFQGKRLGNQLLERKLPVILLEELERRAKVLRRVVVHALDGENLANDRLGGDGKRCAGKTAPTQT